MAESRTGLGKSERTKLPVKRLNVLSELLTHVETNVYETYYGLNCVPSKDAEVPIPSTSARPYSETESLEKITLRYVFRCFQPI